MNIRLLQRFYHPECLLALYFRINIYQTSETHQMFNIEEAMEKCLTMESVFPLVEEFKGRPDAVLRAQCAVWSKIWRRSIHKCSGQKQLLYPGIEMLKEAFLARNMVNLYCESSKSLWVELENNKYCFEVSNTGRLTGYVYTYDTELGNDAEIDMQVMDIVHFTIAFDSMIPEIDDAVEKLFFRYEIEQKVKQIVEITNSRR